MVRLLFIFLAIIPFSHQARADSIENVRFYRISDDRIEIYYNLTGGNPQSVNVEALTADGVRTVVGGKNLSGDYGNGVAPGENRRIVWKPDGDSGSLPDDADIRVVSASAQNAAVTVNGNSREIRAFPVRSQMRLDGALNESSWKDAVPATDFIQRELREGEPATERTEIRILYDRDNLYIGITCFDSEPDRIIHNTMQRDGYQRHDDNIIVVLDTFNDKRSGYYFQTNPNGARYDGIITSIDNDVDEEWNGLWDASAKITDYGWTAEMFIPFKTLRFSRVTNHTWGINFCRDIARKNEEVLWTSWRRDDGIERISRIGSLTGLESIERGRQIQFKPYFLGGVEKDEGVRDNSLKSGLDIKYPITSDMTLDLTTFTDFAQVEADRAEINLTRFSLYYPEKREFFLEGAEIFDFASNYTNPFYSRRIGLTGEGKQIPIFGGAKLIGKAGDYNIGVINMQTDDKNGYPSANHSVVRVKRDVFRQSYIGIIGTNLSNTDDHHSQAYGADFLLNTDRFLTDKNLSFGGYIAENRIPGVNHGTHAGRLRVDYPNDFLDVNLLYHVVGDNYSPELGYVRRNGIKQSSVDIRISPRPDIPFVRQIQFSPVDINYYTDMNDKLLTRSFRFTPLGVDFTTGDEFSFSIEQMYEYIDEEFDIFEDVVIPVGTYTWWNYDVNFETNSSRPFSIDTGVEWGEFYNGERKEYETDVNVKMNEHFSVSADISYNSITIGERSFDTRELGGRINLNVSPRLTSRTFIQYNNESEEINLNFRLHYIPKIGSDIYLVYNHLWDQGDNYRTLYNTGMSKIAYLVTF